MLDMGKAMNEILATQRKLRRLEEYATNLVTSTAAMNAPRALMAVISPTAVGGWMGPKDRSDPTMDGGGAPCPLEFIRKKSERQNRPFPFPEDNDNDRDNGGRAEARYEEASREHPNAAASQSPIIHK